MKIAATKKLASLSAARQAAEAAVLLAAFLDRHPEPSTSLRLSVDDSTDKTEIPVPPEAVVLLAQALSQIARGSAPSLEPPRTELSTQEAADLLNVSRPYLVRLLEERKIPHRRVGNRRRVLLADLLEYRQRDEARRQQILAELAAEAQDMGLGY